MTQGANITKRSTRAKNAAALFGKNVMQCRRFLGMTGKELAARSGLTEAAISQIENGLREPSLSSALAISEGLGAKMSRLVGEQ